MGATSSRPEAAEAVAGRDAASTNEAAEETQAFDPLKLLKEGESGNASRQSADTTEQSVENPAGEAKAASEQAKDWKSADEQLEKAFGPFKQEMDKAGGPAGLRQEMGAIEVGLQTSIAKFLSGERSLQPLANENEEAQKTRLAKETELRESLKEIKPEDAAAALSGYKGAEIQKSVLETLTPEDQKAIQRYQQLTIALDQHAALRFQQARTASEFGVTQKDAEAQKKAIAVLKDLIKADPQLLSDGSSVQAPLMGALIQAERGEMIDLTEQKASSIAYSKSAEKTARYHSHNISDERVTEVLINQQTMALLQNEEQAQREKDLTVKTNDRYAMGFLADAAGVLSSMGVGHTILRTATSFEPKTRMVLALASGAAIGGGVNNLVRGDELLNTGGYAQNGFNTVLTMGAIKGLNSLPEWSHIARANGAVFTGRGALVGNVEKLGGTAAISFTAGAAYEGGNILAGHRQYDQSATWGDKAADMTKAGTLAASMSFLASLPRVAAGQWSGYANLETQVIGRLNQSYSHTLGIDNAMAKAGSAMMIGIVPQGYAENRYMAARGIEDTFAKAQVRAEGLKEQYRKMVDEEVSKKNKN